MKRLSILILLMCMLTGCALPNDTTMSSEPEIYEESYTGSDTVIHEKPTEATDIITPSVPLVTEPQPDFFDGKIRVGENDSLYKLNCPAIEKLGSFTSMHILGGSLLIVGNKYPDLQEFVKKDNSCILSLIDLKTGQIHAEASFDQIENADIQICGDRIALKDFESGTIYMLDNQLETVKTYQIENSWSNIYVDEDAAYAYTIQSDNSLKKIQLATQKAECLMKNNPSLYADTLLGNMLTLHYLNEAEIYANTLLDLSTGELSNMPFEGSFSSVSCVNGLWLALDGAGNGTYLFGRGNNPSVLEATGNTVSLMDGPAALQCVHYMEDGSQELEVFQENGTLFASCVSGNGDGYLSNLVWSPLQNGYLLTSYDTDGKISLLFLDASGEKKSDKVLNLMPIQSTNPETGNAVAEELYERANQISKYYGVKIHIAQQCDTEYDSFEVEREMDHWTISAGLNTLDAALASYPEGFFEQLQYGYYKEVEIDLCGNLTATNIPENPNGYTRFNAFVNHDNNRHKMVLDIHNPKLHQTIFHEFSHIIDSKLDFMSRHREVLYSEERWMKLNPADFNYANSTYIIPEQCRSRIYNKWFIDLYARTFPTEDRARILEYAMSGYDWIFHSEDYAPLREKLAYYSAAIRDAFDTTGWPEVTLWEEPLNGYVYKSAA